MQWNAVSLALVSLLLCVANSAFADPAEKTPFSWTGIYDGYFVCEDVTNGVPSSFGRPMTARIVQTGNRLDAILASDLDRSGKMADGVYRGEVMVDPSGTIASGYLVACGGSFPHLELASIFPAAITKDPFSFAAEAVFVSKATPGAEGLLKVDSCRWRFSRTSTKTPEFPRCAEKETGNKTGVFLD